MPADHDAHSAALVQLRAYILQRDPEQEMRLPPERELSEILGVSRGELRKALAVLEAEGELWRHVGKGTFIGARPNEDLVSLSEISQQTNPAEVMRARLAVEPAIAREAALHATPADLDALNTCLRNTRAARSWRQYETFDNQLHRLIAEAAHNRLLLMLFDTLNTVRRSVVWGRLRNNPVRPPVDHHSFAEHDTIVAAIAERDIDGAGRAMAAHLRSVERGLMGWRDAAE